MKNPRPILLVVCAVCLLPMLASATLYSIQLNGLTSTYSGAAQIGSSGDVWNNPVLTNMDNDNVVHAGTETLASSISWVGSAGVTNTPNLFNRVKVQ